MREDDQLRDVFLMVWFHRLRVAHVPPSFRSPGALSGGLSSYFLSAQQVTRRAYPCDWFFQSKHRRKHCGKLHTTFLPTSLPPKVYCMHQGRFLPTNTCYTSDVPECKLGNDLPPAL